MEGGLTGLYHCRHTNYYRAFHLYHVWLFSATKPERSAVQASASDPTYCLVVSQQISLRLLHAFHVHLLCSILPPGMLSGASSGSGSLYLYCCCWQIIDCNEYE